MEVLRNIYGVYCDYRQATGFDQYRNLHVIEENLAAKLVFHDRIIRVGWDGEVAVEYTVKDGTSHDPQNP